MNSRLLDSLHNQAVRHSLFCVETGEFVLDNPNEHARVRTPLSLSERQHHALEVLHLWITQAHFPKTLVRNFHVISELLETLVLGHLL